jgi:hypothetical protein
LSAASVGVSEPSRTPVPTRVVAKVVAMAVAILCGRNFKAISAPSYPGFNIQLCQIQPCQIRLASLQDAQPRCHLKAFLFELPVAF